MLAVFFSLTFQSFGHAIICAWIFQLPETAMGEGGDVAMGEDG